MLPVKIIRGFSGALVITTFLMQSGNFFQMIFHELPTSKEEGGLLLWLSRADISKNH